MPWRQGTQVEDARLAVQGLGTATAPRDVFCYFDNDIKRHAPFDAAQLARRLGISTGLDASGQFVPPPGMREAAKSAITHVPS